jgi:hypothetical protein
METSDVRKRLNETIERARRQAAERRAASDNASKAFDTFLSTIAVPLVKQIANVLRADGYPFTVFTPSRSVRLMSDKSGQDFIEIALDSHDGLPRVTSHVSRSRGREVIDAHRVVASGDPKTISEDELLTFLLKELEPFVER